LGKRPELGSLCFTRSDSFEKEAPELVLKGELLKIIVIITCVIAICIFGLIAFRRLTSIRSPNYEIDAATRSAVIGNLINELNDGYIFAEKAKVIEVDLRKRLRNGEYDVITDSQMFAEKLTKDLQLVSKDKHLTVRYSVEPLPLRTEKNEPSPEEKAAAMQFCKRIKHRPISNREFLVLKRSSACKETSVISS